MRSALEYIAEGTGSWNDEFDRPIMLLEDAIAAVQAALDDAAKEAANRERYKDLLAMAIINSQPQAT